MKREETEATEETEDSDDSLFGLSSVTSVPSVPLVARRFIITGHVQGVFFRAGARERAVSLGIAGWARNNANGSFEIHAEGSADALQDLERWCARGPEAARVAGVEVRETPMQGCMGFAVL